MKKLLILGALMASTHMHALECSFEKIEATTPVEKFLDNKDGTITDLRFGLMWNKCTFGQTYNAEDNGCVGEGTAIDTWSEAIATESTANVEQLGGFDDWRLPNIKELQSIVERACKNPAIQPAIFPDSINAPYWSNTPDNEVNPELLSRIVDFVDGTEFLKATNVNLYVRHVRSINE